MFFFDVRPIILTSLVARFAFAYNHAQGFPIRSTWKTKVQLSVLTNTFIAWNTVAIHGVVKMPDVLFECLMALGMGRAVTTYPCITVITDGCKVGSPTNSMDYVYDTENSQLYLRKKYGKTYAKVRMKRCRTNGKYKIKAYQVGNSRYLIDFLSMNRVHLLDFESNKYLSKNQFKNL